MKSLRTGIEAHAQGHTSSAQPRFESTRDRAQQRQAYWHHMGVAAG
jgi:hypothetical protein